MSPSPGRLLVLSGPSGVGKDTVIRRLLELRPRLARPVAYTTRDPRPGEVGGREYSFVDEAEFRERQRRGEFLETAEVHGHLYGTSGERVEALLAQGRDVLLKPDVQGAAQLLERFPGALLVFLAPPSREELWARLVDRATETPEQVRVRTEAVERELAASGWYHQVVVNREVEQAAREIAEALDRHPRDQGATALPQ